MTASKSELKQTNFTASPSDIGNPKRCERDREREKEREKSLRVIAGYTLSFAQVDRSTYLYKSHETGLGTL